MKIAILIPSLARTGPILVVQQLVKNLCTEHHFEVFYFDNIIVVEFECKTTRIPFLKYHNFSDFDILHTNMLRSDVYYFLHKDKIKIPAISTIHQYIRQNLTYSYGPITSLIFSKFWKLALSKHGQIICINKHMSEYYTRKKLNENINYIYNGVNKVEQTQIDNIDELLISELKRKYYLMITLAGLNKTKGINQLLPFLAANPNYAYIVLGKGEEHDNLITEAKRLNLGERFQLLGFKNNATSYIHYSDIYVMPSRSEGFGLSLAEAASCSKPLVCSNIESFIEMFLPDEAAFFELDDISSLENAIKKATQNKDVLGKKAFQRFKQSFTAKQMAEKYQHFYQKIFSKSQLILHS